MSENLRNDLNGLRVGLIHGRMKPVEKQQVMDEFQTGKIHLLVATTVIEVGVDVPNATAMVILDADRFGIAQLHQLRGRVGRGEHDSTCWLIGDATTIDGEARLQALVDSTDGFELAEIEGWLEAAGLVDARIQTFDVPGHGRDLPATFIASASRPAA